MMRPKPGSFLMMQTKHGFLGKVKHVSAYEDRIRRGTRNRNETWKLYFRREFCKHASYTHPTLRSRLKMRGDASFRDGRYSPVTTRRRFAWDLERTGRPLNDSGRWTCGGGNQTDREKPSTARQRRYGPLERWREEAAFDGSCRPYRGLPP